MGLELKPLHPLFAAEASGLLVWHDQPFTADEQVAFDLVMWDNRCTLHPGRRFDLSQRRELRRTTTEERA